MLNTRPKSNNEKSFKNLIRFDLEKIPDSKSRSKSRQKPKVSSLLKPRSTKSFQEAPNQQLRQPQRELKPSSSESPSFRKPKELSVLATMKKKIIEIQRRLDQSNDKASQVNETLSKMQEMELQQLNRIESYQSFLEELQMQLLKQTAQIEENMQQGTQAKKEQAVAPDLKVFSPQFSTARLEKALGEFDRLLSARNSKE